jgi:ArsR family transcriptional regulator, arsenate/arsenite/antimonite-responsive transcriptional repressor
MELMSRARKSQLTPEQFHAISRALADPRRFAILQQIASCPHNDLACSAVTECQPISPATISHHMKELQEAGLIDIEREGRTAKLSLRRDTWAAYLDQLGQL